MFTASLRLAVAVLVAGLIPLVPHSASAAEAVHASRGQIELPTYPWKAVKHPYFRGTDGRNIYPYPMLDFLSRDKTNRVYQTVVLENEYLRITFLPELGGKIHEVIDKTTGEPMFYVNHVIKPALIGQAGAWTSGGVEWNTGPQGHTVGCMQPVEVAILPRADDGSQSVAIGETERIYGTKWTVVVTLRPGRSFIEERIRIYNPTETIRPYYFWNCTAAPNTKGFRFIYPMTLGTDHSAEKFFNWPINEGKDLSYGTNYEDASSIFAWHCDQDFFGSYNDDLDRGVVAYANHHQVPGKKAWTWGHGGYGTMHQMDLTDDDGPYNEVQTGPLLTQGEVGRLDPCEAVEWKEWWYPVHAIGGFTFANKDVAVNAVREGTNLTLKVIGTGPWRRTEVEVKPPGGSRGLRSRERLNLSPQQPGVFHVRLPEGVGDTEPWVVELSHSVENSRPRLARFELPLKLPAREVPAKRAAPTTAAELAQAGWQDYLFARFPEAEARFQGALEKDPKCVGAYTGLAYLNLDRDPDAAMAAARNALEVSPDDGRAHYALAVAADRAADELPEFEYARQDALTELALDEAWEAALDPATVVAARALLARLYTADRGIGSAISVYSQRDGVAQLLLEPGPWQDDLLCRDRLAFELRLSDHEDQAIELARANLSIDPLDNLARSILCEAGDKEAELALKESLAANEHGFLDLHSAFDHYWGSDYGWWPLLWGLYEDGCVPPDLMAHYWEPGCMFPEDRTAPTRLASFPYLPECLKVLRGHLRNAPEDGQATLLLGHLLFHLGRHDEGRAMWKKAAELGAEPVIAYRALGMAAKTLDNDLATAREWLEKANQADPTDCIVARDLANVLFALADQSDSKDEKQALTVQAREALSASFEEGKGRSDFVALLARAHSRLGDYVATARLLDSVRITIWEGAREAHDLFEAAHLELGDEALAAGKPREALAQFDRALEYPENLATGRLENTREAHIRYRRGNALFALGRKDEAIQAWRKAAEEAPSRDAKPAEARKLAKEALEVHR
ncbi:MAG: DUF5107 domain-containing protein [Verrucomicrobiales bacterium]|nr:DUF5107 domain-containing protein [Verrucomicrobiales bacterium]